MDINLSSGLNQAVTTPTRPSALDSSGQGPGSAVAELLSTGQSNPVQLNADIPNTSQIPQVDNQTPLRTVPTNPAEQNQDLGSQQDQSSQLEARQQQIETALSELTGQDAANFEGIDLQAALDIQESFRDRPNPNQQPTENSFAPAPEASAQQPDNANELQQQEITQRLQSRLAEQIPNDPGTDFPQLIETVV